MNETDLKRCLTDNILVSLRHGKYTGSILRIVKLTSLKSKRSWDPGPDIRATLTDDNRKLPRKITTGHWNLERSNSTITHVHISPANQIAWKQNPCLDFLGRKIEIGNFVYFQTGGEGIFGKVVSFSKDHHNPEVSIIKSGSNRKGKLVRPRVAHKMIVIADITEMILRA